MYRSSPRQAIASLLLLTTSTTFANPMVDFAAAGRSQGEKDSAGEALARGRRDGLEVAKQAGYADGNRDCEERLRSDAIRRGERQGDIEGALKGREEGSIRARTDGETKGAHDGAADGAARSDRQANIEATPRGTADGIAEANQSDASERGAADGKIAGNNEAKKDAQANEYSPARTQYRAERVAEPIRAENTIVIGATSAALADAAATETPAKPSSSKTVASLANLSSLSNLNLLASLTSFMTSPQDPPTRGGNIPRPGNGPGNGGPGTGGPGNGGPGNFPRGPGKIRTPARTRIRDKDRAKTHAILRAEPEVLLPPATIRPCRT